MHNETASDREKSQTSSMTHALLDCSQAAFFAFKQTGPDSHQWLKLPGLDSQKRYRGEEINDAGTNLFSMHQANGMTLMTPSVEIFWSKATASAASLRL